MSYLRRLPVDILKIAKPFVDDLAGGAAGADEDFTRAIVSLAEALQVQVVAEGIEAASQVTRLLELRLPRRSGLSPLSSASRRARSSSCFATAASEPKPPRSRTSSRSPHVLRACPGG